MQTLNKFKLPKNFRGQSNLIIQLTLSRDFFFFKLSPQMMYQWRRYLLRLFDEKISKDVIIRLSLTVSYPWEISIGKNAVISQKSYLCATLHDYTKEDFPIWSKKITIEDECWLATCM